MSSKFALFSSFWCMFCLCSVDTATRSTSTGDSMKYLALLLFSATAFGQVKTAAQMDQDNIQIQVQIEALHAQLVKNDPTFKQWELLKGELQSNEMTSRNLHFQETV